MYGIEIVVTGKLRHTEEQCQGRIESTAFVSCDTNNSQIKSSYHGDWTMLVSNSNSTTVDIQVNPTDTAYEYYCLQDFFRYDRDELSFPFVAEFQRDDKTQEQWMTPEQETVTTVYGWNSVLVILLIILRFIYNWFHAILNLFRSSYEPTGHDQGINFSDVPSISLYNGGGSQLRHAR